MLVSFKKALTFESLEIVYHLFMLKLQAAIDQNKYKSSAISQQLSPQSGN